jgi:hypothetical protein
MTASRIATGPAHPLGDVGHVEPDHEADGQADQEQGQARVELGHVAQGDRDALGHLLPWSCRRAARRRWWPCRPR